MQDGTLQTWEQRRSTNHRSSLTSDNEALENYKRNKAPEELSKQIQNKGRLQVLRR